MWRKQAGREKEEDQYDCTREAQEAAVLENTCLGQVALRGNTTYEALSLKVGATFMLIYCHSCLTIALDQQQITSDHNIFQCWDVQEALSVRYNAVLIIDLTVYNLWNVSSCFYQMENGNIIQKLIFVFTVISQGFPDFLPSYRCTFIVRLQG